MDGSEPLAERRIREGIARGEFDDLPGAGKPLDLRDADDPDWWLKRFLRREDVDLSAALPPSILLRKEAESFPQSLADLPDEAGVRAVLRDYNHRVAADVRRPRTHREPAIYAHPVDVEAMVGRWRRLRADGAGGGRRG